VARFQYTAVSPDGRSLGGETVAADEAAVAAELGQRGLMLVSLSRLKAEGGGLFSSAIKPREVTAFLSELALMLRSGLPLDEVLDLCARGLSTRLSRVVAALRADVLAGASFVQALEKHPQAFSRDIVAMARVADATGDLGGVFAAVAAQREQAHRLAEKVTGALRYPAFLIVMAVGVLVFFLLQVIPQFAGLFADSPTDPGPLVHFILGLSAFLIANEVALGGGLAALLLLGLLLWRTPASRAALGAAFLRTPGIAGIWLLWRTSRFLANLSVLLGQGVPLTEAMRVLEDSIGTEGRGQLAAVGDAVRRGGRLYDALAASKLLPPIAVRMVRIGEETGELTKIAAEAGSLYARQLEKRLDAVSGLIGPMAIVTIAGLIGGLMVTIMTALVSVNQAVL
jgi:general secretion pathway protein F